MKDQPQISSPKPYMLRALYEWMTDNGLTPHILVDANQRGVKVPRQYVSDGKITLNIAYDAVRHLDMDNDWISFSARFSGAPFAVAVPTDAVMAIHARENGQGMVFQPDQASASAVDDEGLPPEDDTPPPAPRPPRKGRPVLKVVK